MTPMLVCAVLLLAGLVAGGVWSRRDFQIPEPSIDLTPTVVAKRFAWYVSLTMTAGMLAGITVIGAGGRLAMRLLAVTGGGDAQGRLTEAGERVGERLDRTIRELRTAMFCTGAGTVGDLRGVRLSGPGKAASGG